MGLKRTYLLVFCLCCLALWCKTASAGSSFLSPSQKPQNKQKFSRVGRQVMDEPRRVTEEDLFTVSPPFEIGFTMREEDLEGYRLALQEVIQHLLGNPEAAGKPSQL